jgi:thioredoxin reductase (NADPH)
MKRENSHKTLYDVIIIGGGPAGLTASIYTSRARLKTLLIEDIHLLSQVTSADKIENYPGFPEGISGVDLIEKIKKQSRAFNTEFTAGEVEGIQEETGEMPKVWCVLTKEGNRYKGLTVIIASGARPKKLEVSGENEFCGKGVSYCATCDGVFFRDKNIVVVGGGNAAVEEALFLTKFGKKITIIHRRDRLRATKVLQERIFNNKKIEVVFNSQVIEILGKEKVEAVRIKDVKAEKETSISCEGVFIFVGQIPNTDFLKGVVELDAKGYVVADEDMNTSRPGIFVCGDCRKTMLRQVVTACGDGAVAAISARQYIEELRGIAYK